MNAEEQRRLIEELRHSSNCSHPIRLRGDMVNLATGEVGERTLKVACKDRRDALCPACSYLYRTDAWIIASTGLTGGKGVPVEVQTHPQLFVTLTAPSFGAVHTVRENGRCVRRARGLVSCPHGHPTFCPRSHRDGDPLLGQPLCLECFDYDGAVLWNAHASRLWSVTLQDIRRSISEAGGVARTRFSEVAQVHYLKVAEIQRRGLVHFHCLLRVDGPGAIDAEPPAWANEDLIAGVISTMVRRAWTTGLEGSRIEWGSVLDVQGLTNDSGEANKVAGYIAKYSTKTTDGSKDLARAFSSRRQIENLVDNPHLARLAQSAWDLGVRDELQPLRLPEHAHTLGFTGQLITKSRGYSLTFGELRRARSEYMSAEREDDPIEGSFRYEGRGYDDPRGTQLAEFFFNAGRELRVEARETSRDATSKGSDATA
ncbi:MAG: replication initiator [Acidimicrobiales bacterium]